MNGRLVIVTDNHKIPKKYRGPEFRFRATSKSKGTLNKHKIGFGEKFKGSSWEWKEGKKYYTQIIVYKRYQGSPSIKNIHNTYPATRIGDNDKEYSWTWFSTFVVEANLVRFKTDRAIQRDYAPEKLDRQHGGKGTSN